MASPHAPRTAKIVVPRPFKWVRTMRRAMADAGLLELGSTIRPNPPLGWTLEVPCPDAMTEAQVRALARNYLRAAARNPEEEAERVSKKGTHRKPPVSPITRRQYRKMGMGFTSASRRGIIACMRSDCTKGSRTPRPASY